MHGLNKLECWSVASFASLGKSNTLAYWAYLEVTKKMKSCEYDTRGFIFSHVKPFYELLVSDLDP